MKTHFGFIYDAGDYESPLICCDETACGETGEIPCENAVSECELITCKKCLRLKDAIIEGEKEDEKAIIAQMGDMADFENKTGKYAKAKP
jgi:hypothetical protein